MHNPAVTRQAGTYGTIDRVTVIVVSFHSAHCMAALGRGLAECPHVVVVDNASTDDSVGAAGSALPQAEVIRNARNLGFGAANNRGLARSQTEFVLLLNPDCLIDSVQIEALVAAADHHPEASLIAPQLLDRQGRVEANCRWKADTWRPLGPSPEGDACVGFASGACMLIRTAAMRRIGGFDEDFFLYYEDDDLCLRLGRDCGPLIVAPSARVTHLSRASSAGKGRLLAEYNRGYHHIQSKFLFDAKHKGRSTSALRRWRFGVMAMLEAVVRLLLLDRYRACRTIGRAMGVLHYQAQAVRRASVDPTPHP